MGTSKRVWMGAVLSTMVIAGACGGGGGKKAAAPTTSTSTSSSTTTTTEDTTTTSSVRTTSTSSTPRTSLTTFGTVESTTAPPAGEIEIGPEDVAETSDAETSFKQATINGTSYTNAMLVDMSSGTTSAEVQLNAGRHEKRLLGDLGIPDNQKSTSAYKVEISVDNSAPLMAVDLHFGETKKIDLDISNALRVHIKISVPSGSSSSCCSDKFVGIGDPHFG